MILVGSAAGGAVDSADIFPFGLIWNPGFSSEILDLENLNLGQFAFVIVTHYIGCCGIMMGFAT